LDRGFEPTATLGDRTRTAVREKQIHLVEDSLMLDLRRQATDLAGLE
jgi:hypothetical protein